MAVPSRVIGAPRVHFALNCNTRSCPVLPMMSVTAAALGTGRQREARACFARSENFCIDEAARTVWLSEILNFCPKDFVPAHGSSLLAFANRYAPRAALLDCAARFTPCGWTVANSRHAL